MYHSAIRRNCALLTAVLVVVGAVESQAGLFDGVKVRRTSTSAAKAVTKPSARAATKPSGKKSTASMATRRAQSPDYSAGTWQPVSTPWYDTSYQPGGAYGGQYCIECGPCDRLARLKEACRKKCDQTYYQPVPPYCYPCYGMNPTCWRRMQECYICPREEILPAAPPAGSPTKAAPPKVAPPPETTTPPAPVEPEEALPLPSTSRRGASAPSVATVSSQRPASVSPARSRWTGYTDAVTDEDEIPEPPSETLEEVIAGDEAELETVEEGETIEEVDMVEEAEDPSVEIIEVETEDEAVDEAAGNDAAAADADEPVATEPVVK